MRLLKKLDGRYKSYNIELQYDINQNQLELLYRLFNTNDVDFGCDINDKEIFEVRPISENTPWSSNVMKICKKSHFDFVKNVKKSFFYLLDKNELQMNSELKQQIFNKYHDRMTETYHDVVVTEPYCDKTDDIDLLNRKYGLSLDNSDIDYVKNNIHNLENPLFVLLDMAQSNSEHCRHHFFNGKIVENDIVQNKTLFQLVKEPLLNKTITNSLVAFADNSSVIKGFTNNEIEIINNNYSQKINKTHFVLTAETHNFPSGIAPFQGAATGIGGRIRDVQATGIGALPVCSSAGYCVGNVFDNELTYPNQMATPKQILIEASNGASDYGNKFGEPIIVGFTRSFCNTERDRVEWIKPIMFTAGLGLIKDEHIYKKAIQKDMLICKIGGPAYKVGLGGGSASSRISDEQNSELDFSAVQRDDAEMEQKMNRVIRTCISLGNDNPIISIHDQGAGGNGNVLKEIIEDKGAKIDIGKITLGDKTMNDVEIWLSEYQESNALLVKLEGLDELLKICERENVQLDVVGSITDDEKLEIVNGDRKIVSDYPLDFGSKQKTYHLTKTNIIKNKFKCNLTLEEAIKKVLNTITVGSNRFLINKVDRSVSGLVAQQQCVGPLHTPISNYGLISNGFIPYNHDLKNSDSHFMYTGCATSIGEQPIVGLIGIESMVQKTVAEMLTNLMFVLIDDFENISCSANWMWPCPNKDSEEGYNMYQAMKELNRIFLDLKIIIDGGKDSLSMAVRHPYKSQSIIKCPGSLVLSAYAACPNIYKKVTPNLKSTNSNLLFIDLSNGMNMGGSVLSQVINNIYTNTPIYENLQKIKTTFKLIQQLIKEDKILSGHDKSDGGLITTLIEMSISSNIGIDINLEIIEQQVIEYLFNEELGVVIEVDNLLNRSIVEMFRQNNITIYQIGNTTRGTTIRINNNMYPIYEKPIHQIREYWEEPSYKLEKDQCNLNCVEQEHKLYIEQNVKIPQYNVLDRHYVNLSDISKNKTKKVGIIREEGSNSDKEMGSVFFLNYENVHDITTHDLMNDNKLLDNMDIIVFVGGFSYADVLESAKGWYTVIKNNETIKDQFDRFYNRPNTYSLGICNGCQLMIKLGWIGDGIKMIKNDSGRFESRFSSVKINKTKCQFTKDLDNLVYGVWVAHAEGKFVIDQEQLNELKSNDQIVMSYVDNEMNSTDRYPFNPNGSSESIGAICSKNGRHLAMMPHPERSFMKWQIPWMPTSIEKKMSDYTPWFRMFNLEK